MTTNLHSALTGIDRRWEELDVLIGIARGYDEAGAESGALRRSVTVLTCSHLEGSLKSVARAVVADINDFSSFSEAPEPLKRRYVADVIMASGEVDQRVVSRLVQVLSSTEFKMDEESLFAKNGNPKAALVDQFYKVFKGDRASLFPVLAGSSLMLGFEGDRVQTSRLLGNVKRSCKRGSAVYPYNMSGHYFGGERGADLFKPFLEDLLQKRHAIVHGNTLSSELGVRALEDYISKAQLLLYGFVLAVGQAS